MARPQIGKSDKDLCGRLLRRIGGTDCYLAKSGDHALSPKLLSHESVGVSTNPRGGHSGWHGGESDMKGDSNASNYFSPLEGALHGGVGYKIDLHREGRYRLISTRKIDTEVNRHRACQLLVVTKPTPTSWGKHKAPKRFHQHQKLPCASDRNLTYWHQADLSRGLIGTVVGRSNNSLRGAVAAAAASKQQHLEQHVDKQGRHDG